MKKIILVAALIATLSLLSSCNQKNTSCENATEKPTSPIVTLHQSPLDNSDTLGYSDTLDYSDINNLPEPYLRVIQGEDKFTRRGKEMYLNEYIVPSINIPLVSFDSASYGIIDMDGDGSVELLLTDAVGGDILMLHYEEGTVYGFLIDFRSMYHVKKDGSFDWNASAGREYGAAKLSPITGNYCQSTELFRFEHDHENHENNKIFIADVEVTKNEFDEYKKSLCDEQIEWYKLYPEKTE